MKLVTKNDYKFATGMFWQIPDEGKHRINLAKIAKDTKNNMFCSIKVINPTWGFCHREELHNERKVASLGKFIIEASKLSASYTNSIICFKFKNAGESDEDGRRLEHDLYGYIVLLNGTICPEEGEYVANFIMIRESIIQQAKKYEIETLYLPVEVALQLFSVFEVLADARHQGELLPKVLSTLNSVQKSGLDEFILHNLSADYSELLGDNPLISNLDLLHQLIDEEEFSKKIKQTKDQNLKYLIPNIYTLAYTSDEIYWQQPQFKNQFNKALIGSVAQQTSYKYKVGLLVGLIGAIIYFTYALITESKREIRPAIRVTPETPKPAAVSPYRLIDACLQGNDRFFKDLGSWTFSALKCNSLGAVLTFTADNDTTLSRFIDLIGKNAKNIKLNNRIGTYSIAYRINPAINSGVAKEQVLERLQQGVIDYGLKVSLPQQAMQSNTRTVNKFSITAKQSPLFLLKHQVLDGVRLTDINMSFDRSSGFYTWTLLGEF